MDMVLHHLLCLQKDSKKMKIKVGLKFKAIEGLSKGKLFTVTQTGSKEIVYRCEESGRLYTVDRKHFEKYLERVNKHWSQTNKAYKYKKGKMKGE